MNSVGVVLATARGPVAVLCVYAPPGPVIERDEWASCLGMMNPYSEVFFVGTLMRIMLVGAAPIPRFGSLHCMRHLSSMI